MRSLTIFKLVSFAIYAVISALLWTNPLPAQAANAEQVHRLAGIEAGLAVVIAEDAELACDLADEGRSLVHLLTPKAQGVDELQRSVQQRKFGGRVVV